MTINATALSTSFSDTDATSYATASITPTANRLVLAWVASQKASGEPATPTATGNGLTWVNVGVGVFTGFGPKITLLRAMGASPSAGAVTFDFGGETQLHAAWSIVEFSGVDLGGTNGSGAIVQAVGDRSGSDANSFTVTLAAFGNGNNGAAGGFSRPDTAVISPGSGFTEIGQAQTTDSGMRIFSEWRATNDTTVDASAATIQSWQAVAVELKAAPDSGFAFYRPYTLGADVNSLVSGLWYYWRRRKQEKPDE